MNCAERKKSFIKRAATVLALVLAVSFMLCLFGCNGGLKAKKDAVITEVVTSNSNSLRDSVYGSPDWLEIHNPTNSELDISGYTLSGDDPNLVFTFGEGTTLAAGQYITVVCTSDVVWGADDKFKASFNLSVEGVTVVLTNAEGEDIQTLRVPPLAPDIAYAIKQNGDYGFTAFPSPAAQNDDSAIYNTLDEAKSNIVVTDSLCLSEVFRGDNGFVEVYNPTNASIRLRDFYLTDDTANSTKWRFPDATLEPGVYAVVNLMGSTFTGDKVNPDNGEGYASYNADFKLNTAEYGIYLYNGYGDTVDRFVFDVLMPEVVSAVRTQSGMMYTAHVTKGAANSENVFASIGWTQMDDSDSIRITEVLPKNRFSIIDGDGDRNEWVELYNSSDSAISLAGYYLSDNEANPDKWAFPDITLQSGEYIVIFLSGKDRTTGELHTSFGLSDADEGIFLFNFSGMRMDCLSIPSDMHPNVSIGRGSSGEVLYYAQPTPGAENASVGFNDYMGVGGFNPSSVYINETCSVQEPRSGQMDWIEFYNGSDTAITLSGWHISDDSDNLMKYELSSVTVPARGYAVMSCSSNYGDQGAGVAPFSLSSSGETLILSDSTGVIIDVFETGTNLPGITSGRVTGSEDGERVFFETATKGWANPSVCYLTYAAEPTFSNVEMYHSAPFTLELFCRNADGVIRYTTDGSKPTENSRIYEGQLTITENTVVRAATFIEGKLPSDSVTMNYLFEEPHTLPVVCLSMDEADFNVMYAVSKPFVPIVERECYMQYFDADGRLGVQSAAGVRVSGASTRAYPQKSLGLYFRSGYGRNEITYPFFGSDYVTTFGSLVLRNAGQDCLKARIRDSFASTSVIDMNLDASESEFVVVYINGEYWGLYDLKENMNEDYLVSHYGVDGDTANIIKRNTMELEGSNADFLRVRSYVVQKDAAGNNYVVPLTAERYEQFCQWVDEKSIMDYLIARSYFPDSDMFNQKYWRTVDYKVRWRAIFFDSDFALSSIQGNVISHYFNVVGVPSANGSLSQMDLYCGLNSNEQWRHDFIVRYIYVTKYYLNNERLLPHFDSMVAAMNPEMDRHIARWGRPESRAVWEKEIASLRTAIEGRGAYAIQYLRNYYGITDAQYQTFEAEADAIHQANGGVFK